MTDSTGMSRGIFNCPNCGGAASPDSTVCPYCQSSLATLVCSSCYGAVRIGMRHCPACGTAANANEKRAAGELKCPRCTAALSEVRVGSRAMAQCLRCGGLWTDRETLESIGSEEEDQEAVLAFAPEISDAPKQSATARAYVPCPVCKRLMNRTNYANCSGVIVDWCRQHGSWFDRDELRQIVEFIRRGGMRKSREKQKEAIRLETERLRDQQRELSRISRVVGQSESFVKPESASLFGLLHDIWRNLE